MTFKNKIRISKFQQWVFCAAIGTAWPIFAQETTVEPPPVPPVATPTPRAVVNSPSVLAHSEEPLRVENEPPFQWGPISLRPHLTYRFIYGDGIQPRPGESAKTAINEISPGILLGLGTKWTLDYTPTMSFYSSSLFHDTLGHYVILSGNNTYEKWVLGLSQSYLFSSEPLVETGTQTEQQIYATALSASYHFNDEMWLDLGVNQTFRFADDLISGTNAATGAADLTDSREWNTLDWLNYQFAPHLDAGVGAGFGYVDMQPGADMTYEQVLARVRWHATEKIFLSVNGGVEFRQFLQGADDGVVNPLFGTSIEYHPFEHTTLSLNADRRVTVSYFENQITEVTEVLVSLNQRLLEKLNLNLIYGYSNTRYVTSSDSTNRRDNNSFVNLRISCPIRQRLILAAFYNWSDNSSTESDFAYTSNQIGLEARLQY